MSVFVGQNVRCVGQRRGISLLHVQRCIFPLVLVELELQLASLSPLSVFRKQTDTNVCDRELIDT